MPDGFEDLKTHNLITLKSYCDTMSEGTLEELIGHCVNYRKRISTDKDKLVDRGLVGLFAISARYPQNLLKELKLKKLKTGVYKIGYCTRSITLIVIDQLPN